MQLIRFGETGREKPGVILDGGIRVDVSGFGSDYDEVFFQSGGLEKLSRWLKENGARAPRVDSALRLGAPIVRPSKIVCIGLNYRKHALEAKMQVPPEPVIFMKASTALCGPNDDVVIPRDSTKLDYEVELAVIIGKKAQYVRKEDAIEYVGGYAIMNDYSERNFQMERSGQWSKGKSADTFAPLGPFLATTDEIPNPGNLKLWLKVNGGMRQNSSTADLVFDVPTLVSYVSLFMTLLPGDIISTGTPEGVAMGMNPPEFLKPGDVVEQGIEGLGISTQKIVAWEAS
jgi:2-keto-4-pentenoate hydratase/2-oxohepta-3-ene-1,7-dioic acid hydratase in catechol pathway